MMMQSAEAQQDVKSNDGAYAEATISGVALGRDEADKVAGVREPAVAMTGRTVSKSKKNPAAVQLGRKGGKARAAKLSAKERKRIAKLGAATRWKNHK